MSHFNVSLIVWAKSQDSVQKSQFLNRRERRAKADRTKVLLLTSQAPYRWPTPAHNGKESYRCVYRLHASIQIPHHIPPTQTPLIPAYVGSHSVCGQGLRGHPPVCLQTTCFHQDTPPHTPPTQIQTLPAFTVGRCLRTRGTLPCVDCVLPPRHPITPSPPRHPQQRDCKTISALIAGRCLWETHPD